MTPDSVPYHVGYAVNDLDAAVGTYREAGVETWVFSQWSSTGYFDAGTGSLIEPRYRVAYGRLNESTSVEFLEADPAGPVPLVWTVSAAGVGTAHIGHWVRDTKPVAQRLLRKGGRVVMARASSPAIAQWAIEQGGDADTIPDDLDTCYVLTAAGHLVELVPAGIWAGRLVTTFGEDVPAAIVRPPDRMLPA